MGKRIVFLMLLLMLAMTAQGQKVEVKKCNSCGKPLKECSYKGKHPQPGSPDKPTPDKPTPPPQKPRYGTLNITSSPSGAVVKVDGKYKGETPVTLERQNPGRYTVTFSADGYESTTKNVLVTAGERATCHASLKKKNMSNNTQQGSQQSSGTSQNQSSAAIRIDGSNQTFTVGGVSFTMVYVEGGTFTMGCTREQGYECRDNETPAHSVTLSSYYIGETEVTQALWKAVMGTEPTYNGGWTDQYGRGTNYPAYKVSYTDVETFITRLNQKTGRTFRMPTEAEWEYAARGGKKSRGYKYSGSHSIGDVAWYEGNSGDKTHPVRQKQPNELGIYDMLGNVREWCNDWYGSYSSGSQTNPKGPSSGSYRVDRGGSWVSFARVCRVSYRGSGSPSDRNIGIGFRLALVP